MRNSTFETHLLTFVGVLLFAGVLSAQLKSQPVAPSVTQQMRSVVGSSLLDPNRFSMSHGISMSFMSGSGLAGGAGGLSVYSNQISYLLSDNMIITNQLYLVQPTTGGGQPGESNVQAYFNTVINWRIFRNTQFSLAVSNQPAPRRYPTWSRFYPPFVGPNQDHSEFLDH